MVVLGNIRTLHMKMANTLTSIILVILFCGLAVGSRTKLISVKGQDGMFALAPVPNDGICTSMVETKGYVCEDHKVIWLHTLLFALQVLKFIAAIYLQCNLNFKLFQVTTQDVYILSMQRIPAGRSGKTAGKRPPVLLQHGLLMVGYCSMNDWLSQDS